MGDGAKVDEAQYATAAEVLSDRIAWTLASFGRLSQEARQRGWLPGEVANDDDNRAATVRVRIDARLSRSAIDVRVLPLEWLRLRLSLSMTEYDALWMLACVDAEPAVARAASVFAVPECAELSVQVLRRLVPITGDELDHLIRLGLIEVGAGAQHSRYVRAVDRVVELALGELRLDPVVAAVADLVEIEADGPTREVAQTALLVAKGIEGCGRATLLRRMAARTHRGTLEVRVRDLASEPALMLRQVRGIAREALLFDVVPLLREMPPRGTVAEVIDAELLRTFPGIVMGTAEETPSTGSRPLVVESVPPLTTIERAQVWARALPGASTTLIEQAAERYAIAPGAIVATARNVMAAGPHAEALTIESIHAGLRDHLGQRLGSLAKRIEWKQTWNDLVLPEAQREQVAELIARVKHRSRVLDEQGFAAKVAKGHGVVALMSGEPGTGKTMVAGLVAAALGLDLYQVDLSVVVSKYIGETEKGLAKVFDAAESGHIVLLFDEADALFAKRSEVKSSNDRYANLETNYLLQRLEAFAGISILTTNNEAALDDAFRRRIAVHVKFPMPEEDERVRLWRAMFPANAAVSGEIDLRKLARDFEMSGGHIKNAVLRAAYFAASQDSPITMLHLRRAARAEYEAMGRIVTTGSTL